MAQMLARLLLTKLILTFAMTVPAGAADAPAAVRIAVVQLDATKVGNFDAMREYARLAKAGGAQIVVFPETSDMGWLNPDAFFKAAPIPGAVSDKFAEIARSVGIWVVAGLAERGRQIATQPATYEAYDAAVMIDTSGAIVLHHRQFNVLKNAFSSCPAAFGSAECSYTAGSLNETKVAETPFGTVGLFVCADAYTYDTASLDALKPHQPDLVIIPWGITAGSQGECGQEGFNATSYAAQAAAYLQTAHVVGANATGERPYGRFLPSWYCGTSGFATPDGRVGGVLDTDDDMGFFDVPAQ